MITPHADYLALGATKEERADRYRNSIAAVLHANELQAIRRATNSNFALGNGDFVSRLETQLQRRVAPIYRKIPKKGTDHF